jgi:hypothetical protein
MCACVSVCAGDRTQGFECASQVLYPWAAPLARETLTFLSAGLGFELRALHLHLSHTASQDNWFLETHHRTGLRFKHMLSFHPIKSKVSLLQVHALCLVHPRWDSMGFWAHFQWSLFVPSLHLEVRVQHLKDHVSCCCGNGFVPLNIRLGSEFVISRKF